MLQNWEILVCCNYNSWISSNRWWTPDFHSQPSNLRSLLNLYSCQSPSNMSYSTKIHFRKKTHVPQFLGCPFSFTPLTGTKRTSNQTASGRLVRTHRKVNEDHVSCCSAIWSWHLDMIENAGRGLGVRSRLVEQKTEFMDSIKECLVEKGFVIWNLKRRKLTWTHFWERCKHQGL